MEKSALLSFPKIIDLRGNLTFLQHPDQLPFPIARVFWIYDVPGGEHRGGHAYKEQQEIIIALSGSFDVVMTNPNGLVNRVSLNRSYVGIWVPPLTWRHIENFSTNSLGLHLSSKAYSEDDYVRNFDAYKRLLE